MFWSWIKFYDDLGNFDNAKLLKLLEDAKRARKRQSSSKLNKSWDIVLFWWASKKEVWQFINRLSIFANSWLDVKWALWIIIKQTKNAYLKKIIIEIKENIDHWILINSSMSRYPQVFDPLTIALIWVWEKTGLLGKILSDLDKNMLESIELKSKIKWAMIYPVILFLLTIAMVIFMMVFIVPRIAWAFAQQWVELPWLTKIVISISEYLQNDYLSIIWVIFVIYVVYRLIKSTYSWRLFYARIAMNLPVFGFVVKQSNIIYFIKSFSTLLDSWVLLLDSIKTSSQVVPNLAYKREIIRIKNEVEFWLTISKSMWLNMEYEENIYLNIYFPEEFAYVVNTWEETWTLSESIKKFWTNYNKELKRYIWNMSTMMEPFIIVVVGALVWTIVLAIMMPFFELWKVVQQM